MPFLRSKLIKVTLNKNISTNLVGRDFVVGDIHGQLYELLIQLEEVSFDFNKDRLFTLGDIIDRGAQSEQCLDLLRKPWFFSVLGNHEYIFLEQFLKHDFDTSQPNIGNQWLEKWQGKPRQLAAWFELIKANMPVCITLNFANHKIGLVHATPPKIWPNSEGSATDLTDVYKELWDREAFYNRNLFSDYEAIDLVMMGHNPVCKATLKGNRIWLDSKHTSGRFSILEVSKLIDAF